MVKVSINSIVNVLKASSCFCLYLCTSQLNFNESKLNWCVSPNKKIILDFLCLLHSDKTSWLQAIMDTCKALKPKKELNASVFDLLLILQTMKSLRTVMWWRLGAARRG